MQKKLKLLICDDDKLFHLSLKRALENHYDLKSAYNGDEALAILKNNAIDLMILDVQMRSQNEGLDFIPRFKEISEDLIIIMASGMTDFSTVKEAMRLGALDYVSKISEKEEIQHAIQRALERQRLRKKAEQQNFETQSHQKKHVLIGESLPILQLRKTIDRIKNRPANVIITGETGTGKEVVARLLRRKLPDGTLEPFVAVDSSTIQSTTAESILFGHEKGAFTGADSTTKGVFEEANCGTVYFDEIANMSLQIQAKLLRVVQEQEVIRLGSTRPIQLEFRVICATNRDLDEMVKQGLFKNDLLQRLSVFPLSIPPLRERKDDIPLLLNYFSERHARGGTPIRFSPACIEVLKNYAWPGNVRELSNNVAFWTAMIDGTTVDVSDLDLKIVAKTAAKDQLSDERDFYKQVAAFEKQLLEREYAAAKGNISRLAEELKMDRSHLYSKLKQYGIHEPRK